MKRKRLIRSMTFVLAVIPLIALANGYDWIGPSGDFDVYTNWTSDTECVVPADCYPRSCNDDATIVIEAGRTVYLSTQTIDDLTLAPWGEEVDVTLDAQGTQQTLTCDTLTIDMSSLGHSLVLTGKGIIKTQACP